MASLVALESKVAQVTQMLAGLSGSIGGNHSLGPNARDNTNGNITTETGRGPQSVGQWTLDFRNPQ